jgi:glycosyltransferase involved in cell wall biosynthesis
MRIGFNFHCADDYISGVEYYSMGLLRSLLDIDRQNLYIVFTNKPEIITSHIGSRNNLIIKDCSFLKTRLYRIIWEHLKLPGLTRKENLNILHCPHYICAVFKSSVPYIITIHDTIAIDNPEFCKKANAAYYNIFMKPAVSKAAAAIAVSSFTADRLYENFSANSSKVHVIYPGIDEIFNTFQNTERLTVVQTKYKLPEKFILYCGNIEPKKNILNLLRAFKLLKLKNTKCCLVSPILLVAV